MIYSQETARQTAKSLLQINAIKLNPKNPFTWASGWKSPIYCDNRVALSYPKTRSFLAHKIAEQAQKLYGEGLCSGWSGYRSDWYRNVGRRCSQCSFYICQTRA